MNAEQYYKWKEDTKNALTNSNVYSEEEAQIITDWFDSIKGKTERSMFGDELIDALSKHWENSGSENFVYKTLTARAWLYADAILKKHSEG